MEPKARRRKPGDSLIEWVVSGWDALAGSCAALTGISVSIELSLYPLCSATKE